MNFEIIGEITKVEVIATGRGIRVLSRLTRQFGAGSWRKLKGSATIRLETGMLLRRNYTGTKRMGSGSGR